MGSTAAKVITGGFLFGFFVVLIATLGKSFEFIAVVTKPILALAQFFLAYFGVSFTAPSVVGTFFLAVAVGVVYAVIFLLVDLVISFFGKK